VIRFFTLKGLKARAIHTELESVYDPEALDQQRKVAKALSPRENGSI
jgi:hypothetical protein